MRSVFIPFYSNHRFLSLLSFAKALNNYKDINVFVDSIGLENKNSKILYSQNFLFLNKKKSTLSKYNRFRNIYVFLRPFFMRFSLFNIFLEKNYLNFLKINGIKYKNFFIKNNIKTIFLLSDRKGGVEASIAYAANKLNVKIIIPYLVNYADHKRLLNNKKIIKITNIYSLFSKIKFRKYILENKKFYDFYIFNALFKFNLLSSNPWVVGFGQSDVICCDSNNTKMRLSDLGVKKNKLLVIGDVILDRLYESYNSKNYIKNFVRKKYNVDSDQKIIVVSLPQLFEHNLYNWNEHISEIEFLITSIHPTKNNVLISLHPKMKLARYEYLEKKFNVKIVQEDLVEILPIADIFIATYSSTIVWSILCEINTIIVDFYDLNYDFFNHLINANVFKDKTKFKNYFLSESIFNRRLDFSKDWNQLSRKETFDGNVIKRYIDIIE